MTYEQHVREVAEEMAKADNDRYIDPIIIARVKDYDHAARIAVRREAAEYEAGYRVGRTMNVYDKVGLKTMLIHRGLIPAPEVNDTCRRCGISNRSVKNYFSVGAALCKDCFINSPSNELK